MTKNPTSTDKKILAHIQAGHKVNNIVALDMFGTVGLRDSIYRLRQAGNAIQSERKDYKNKNGQQKWFQNYFMERVTACQ